MKDEDEINTLTNSLLQSIAEQQINKDGLIDIPEDEISTLNSLLNKHKYLSDLLSKSTDSEIQNILNSAKIKFVSKGAFFLSKSLLYQNVYILLKGEIKLNLHPISKPLLILNFLEGLLPLLYIERALCLEDTFLLVINRSSFSAILKYKNEKKIEKFIKFFRNFTFFNSLKNEGLRKLYILSEKMKFFKNDILFREKEKINVNYNGIYFIKQGVYMLSKKTDGLSKESELKQIENELKVLKFEGKKLENCIKRKIEIKIPKIRTANDIINSKLMTKTLKKSTNITILSSKNIVGDVEILSNLIDHPYTIVCQSDISKCYFIPYYFIYLLNDEVYEEFINQVTVKSERLSHKFLSNLYILNNKVDIEKFKPISTRIKSVDRNNKLINVNKLEEEGNKSNGIKTFYVTKNNFGNIYRRKLMEMEINNKNIDTSLNAEGKEVNNNENLYYKTLSNAENIKGNKLYNKNSINIYNNLTSKSFKKSVFNLHKFNINSSEGFNNSNNKYINMKNNFCSSNKKSVSTTKTNHYNFTENNYFTHYDNNESTSSLKNSNYPTYRMEDKIVFNKINKYKQLKENSKNYYFNTINVSNSSNSNNLSSNSNLLINLKNTSGNNYDDYINFGGTVNSPSFQNNYIRTGIKYPVFTKQIKDDIIFRIGNGNIEKDMKSLLIKINPKTINLHFRK